MKTTKSSRPYQLREFYRKQIGQLGNFVEGTLCEVRRAGRKAPTWQLTFKRAGKTHTLYVPVDLAQEVEQWTREFRRLKELARRVTKQNLAIIRGHVGNRRAASRARRLKAGRSAGNSSG